MCNCKKTTSFKENLNIAQNKTIESGEQYVVFIMEKVEAIFVAKESQLEDYLQIECYYLPDGTEKKYISKNAESIQLVDVEIVTPKKKK